MTSPTEVLRRQIANARRKRRTHYITREEFEDVHHMRRLRKAILRECHEEFPKEVQIRIGYPKRLSLKGPNYAVLWSLFDE